MCTYARVYVWARVRVYRSENSVAARERIGDVNKFVARSNDKSIGEPGTSVDTHRDEVCARKSTFPLARHGTEEAVNRLSAPRGESFEDSRACKGARGMPRG